MRLGCFGKTDQIAAIRSAGYDSAELDFCELTNMDENAFLSFYKEVSAKVADIVRHLVRYSVSMAFCLLLNRSDLPTQII
ncbi:MAG: hypothetical protein ACLVEV_04325 [Lachnospiraceae bacterium]|mgnify:FL=1